MQQTTNDIFLIFPENRLLPFMQIVSKTSYFAQKSGFDLLCKLSPKSIFSWKSKYFKMLYAGSFKQHAKHESLPCYKCEGLAFHVNNKIPGMATLLAPQGLFERN